MKRTSWVLSLQLFLAAASLAESFRVVRDLPLPAQFDGARDVRIVGDPVGSEIALLVDDGLWGVRFDPAAGPRTRLLASAGGGTDGPWAAYAAGLDQTSSAIGAPAFEVVVRRAGQPRAQVVLEMVFDLDVREGTLAVFGASRVEDQMAPDGAIAFVVQSGSEELKPVIFAASGPGAPATVGCHLLRSGALRFDPEGNLLIAPATEPGVHLLDRQLRPQRVWAGDALPTGPRCPRTDAERREFSMSPRTRFQVLNSTSSIEEVFFAGGDPWVVVRQPLEKSVSWHAVRLLPDGGLRRVELGLPEASEFTILRADAAGGSLMVLTFERPLDARMRGARLYELRLDEIGTR